MQLENTLSLSAGRLDYSNPTSLLEKAVLE